MNLFLEINSGSLLVKQQQRILGKFGFLQKLLLPIFGFLLMSTLFTSVGVDDFSWNTASKYIFMSFPYFLFLAGLHSGFGNWESELTTGIGEYYSFRRANLVLIRGPLFVVEIVPQFLFLLLIALLFPQKFGEFCIFGPIWAFLGFCLGLNLGLWVGFRGEKSINNFLHFSTWALALGPGPIAGHEKFYFWQALFPGFGLSQNNSSMELWPLIFWLVLMGICAFKAKQAQPGPFFKG